MSNPSTLPVARFLDDSSIDVTRVDNRHRSSGTQDSTHRYESSPRWTLDVSSRFNYPADRSIISSREANDRPRIFLNHLK